MAADAVDWRDVYKRQAFVSLPLLVSFMPMLMDTAGNCGNQISTRCV